jgi:hypothetical protein
MAIIIKELVIKGKVVRNLPDVQIRDGLLENYLKKVKSEITEACKEQVKEELERESSK